MLKCRKCGVRAPVMYHVDLKNHLMFMERVEGKTVRNHLFEDKCPWTGAEDIAVISSC